ncbi:MAG: hypothetical protein QOI12_3831 [Alphaproteobacteria bacterium]|jgi:hypothetical protein|nr:hypothetical protein [Alphaproteobacteria bacterium]
MQPLPLSAQTLYANLAQGMSFSSTRAGSIFTQVARSKRYLYVTEKHGATRLQTYLGPADDPNVQRKADDIRRAEQAAKLRRTTVSTLKRMGLPAPTLYVGRLLEVLAKAGLFQGGVVLVGTAAYALYSPLVGVALSHAAMSTEDADLAVASLAVTSAMADETLLDILKRADPTFVSQLGLDPRSPPRRFRSSAGFEVDVITRYRKRADEERAVRLAGLQCSAQPLRYLEYLFQEPVTAVALYGAGVEVAVPQPARYAVHKLIVAQVRIETSIKHRKDLAQAKELIAVLNENDPHRFSDALEDARRRGSKWRSLISRSLSEIGLGRNS